MTNVDFENEVDFRFRHVDSCGKSDVDETQQTRSVEEAQA